MADRIDLDDLRMLDDRILVETVPDLPPHGCQLCQMLDCHGDARVCWWSRIDGRSCDVRVNTGHLLGWVPGWVVPDSQDEQIQIEVPA